MSAVAGQKRACGKCERTLPIIDNQKIRPPRHDEPELVLLFASSIPVCFGLCARSVLNLHDRIQGSQVAARLLSVSREASNDRESPSSGALSVRNGEIRHGVGDDERSATSTG